MRCPWGTVFHRVLQNGAFPQGAAFGKGLLLCRMWFLPKKKKSAPAWATIPARNPCFCMGSPQATAQISALRPSCVLQQGSLLHHTAHYNCKITAPSPEVPLSPFPWPLCLQGCFSHTFSLSAAVQQSLPFLKYPLNQHHSLAWLWPAEQQSALAGIPIK